MRMCDFLCLCFQGPLSARVVRLLLDRAQLEEKQVGDVALIPAKEARALLYKLLAAKVVHLQEIPRKPDHAPMNTYYLWSVVRPVWPACVVVAPPTNQPGACAITEHEEVEDVGGSAHLQSHPQHALASQARGREGSTGAIAWLASRVYVQQRSPPLRACMDAGGSRGHQRPCRR